jgi:hypothetical protein
MHCVRRMLCSKVHLIHQSVWRAPSRRQKPAVPHHLCRSPAFCHSHGQCSDGSLDSNRWNRGRTLLLAADRVTSRSIGGRLARSHLQQAKVPSVRLHILHGNHLPGIRLVIRPGCQGNPRTGKRFGQRDGHVSAPPCFAQLRHVSTFCHWSAYVRPHTVRASLLRCLIVITQRLLQAAVVNFLIGTMRACAS